MIVRIQSDVEEWTRMRKRKRRRKKEGDKNRKEMKNEQLNTLMFLLNKKFVLSFLPFTLFLTFFFFLTLSFFEKVQRIGRRKIILSKNRKSKNRFFFSHPSFFLQRRRKIEEKRIKNERKKRGLYDKSNGDRTSTFHSLLLRKVKL